MLKLFSSTCVQVSLAGQTALALGLAGQHIAYRVVQVCPSHDLQFSPALAHPTHPIHCMSCYIRHSLGRWAFILEDILQTGKQRWASTHQRTSVHCPAASRDGHQLPLTCTWPKNFRHSYSFKLHAKWHLSINCQFLQSLPSSYM